MLAFTATLLAGNLGLTATKKTRISHCGVSHHDHQEQYFVSMCEAERQT